MDKRFFANLLIIIAFVVSVFSLLQYNSSGADLEIRKIKSFSTTSEQSEELLKLLNRVGPVVAQEEMFQSGLPFTGETHLLIHTIGNYIYDKYGIEGLSLCRDYFLSACYHGFIINTLGDHGVTGVAKAIEKCNKAGGGVVSSQCAHAAGHGFVAWQDYDLLKALEMCDDLGKQVEGAGVSFGYFNCYDGVFMENVWGVHDGAPSEKRWVNQNDVYYPCNDPRIPEKYLEGCWADQATLIYQHFKGDLRKTAQICDGLENDGYKEMCFNNLSRQIHPLTQGSIDKVFTLCKTTGENWYDYCILTNMSAYWSVGDHQIPKKICQRLTGSAKAECFTRLNAMINR